MSVKDLILDKETKEKLLEMYNDIPTLYKMHEPLETKKKYFGCFRL